ncbi:MAG: 23S rRNA (adenine(2503)-C(2))-methyltransferase RlmN [Acidobacteria bacterium]|nr:23S rRNA (adenine(2503)-C(2))-methyltransferase RlmN [Acidobacteriota bacterium]
MIGRDFNELRELVAKEEQPSYRAQQLFEGIYRQRVASVVEISTLPQALRQVLEEKSFHIGLPGVENKFASRDGTERYLLRFADGHSVETVWMPQGDEGEAGDGSEAGDELEKRTSWDRATICVSSQAGCAVDCRFCLTALLGLRRNLTAGEIVGQIAVVLRDQRVSPARQRVNLVFMGMGEPFLNYDNLIKAVHLLADGVQIPASRMTVSTVGIVPRITDFGREALRPKLAISLNASNDELRTALMPVNRKWNLAKLMAAARQFPLRPREKLTFEYVLLDHVNDSETNARELVELIRGLQAKVNLIALNPGPGITFRTPPRERVLRFQSILLAGGVPAFIRRPRGRDIYAACGQLKRTRDLMKPML